MEGYFPIVPLSYSMAMDMCGVCLMALEGTVRASCSNEMH